MTIQQQKIDSTSTAQTAIEALQEKKGIDITLLDLRKIGNAVADYFIVCTGSSDTQTGALTDQVEKDLAEKLGLRVWKKEGQQQGQWIILDYADVVVHIFLKGRREVYDLEGLWGDAKITQFD